MILEREDKILLGMTIKGLRKVTEPDSFFEKWQVLNFENTCADLLNCLSNVYLKKVLLFYSLLQSP